MERRRVTERWTSRGAVDRQRLVTLGALGGSILLAIVFFGRSPKQASAMRTPTDPNEVLETLPLTKGPGSAGGEVIALREQLAQNPNNLHAAERLARLDIQLARQHADPRYLGQAQAILGPWWNDDAPPEVLVLRATIEQSLHDFDSALKHLDMALAKDPTDAQGWLTRAVVLTVTARYDEARASCAKVQPLVDALAFAVCDTQIDSLLGKAKPAFDRLEGVLERSPFASIDEQEWAISTLGEYANRYGAVDIAEKDFKKALEVSPDDAYVRGALADLLTDLGRYDEAIALTKGHENDDALLLRLAIAERRAKKDGADEHIDMLGARFAASRARGDVVHRREEARFWLELKDDPGRAYSLAKANWGVQREPADARIYLAAAKAAKQPADDVEAHLAKTHLEGPGISR